MADTITTASATAKFVRVSPMKARRVLALVRGKDVAEALAILRMEVEASHRDGPEGRDGATVPLPPDPDV